MNGYYRARYYEPSVGRFLSEDPAAFIASLNFYEYASNSPAMWIDSFGLIEGSPNNKKRRNHIADLAESYDGSTNWSFYKKKPPFPVNTNKCNLFVYDVTTEAGAEPRIPGRPKWPMPTASEWANPKVKIPHWRSLKDNETPEPGDVAAFVLDWDPSTAQAPYTGRSGIIIPGSREWPGREDDFGNFLIEGVEGRPGLASRTRAIYNRVGVVKRHVDL
jgi:hypothetical protein